MKRSYARVALAVAIATTGLAGLSATATAADPPATAATAERQLTALQAQKRDCFRRADGAGGVDSTTWKSPMSGYATVRLAAPDASDWDLAVFDKASGRYIDSSASFGSHEVVQSWVGSGQELLIQGCRRSGDAGVATASVELLDVQPPAAPKSASLVRVDYGSEQNLNRLEGLGLDVTHNVQDGHADVIANADERAALTKNGFTYQTRIADLTASYAKARSADASLAQAGGASLPSGERSTYRTYEEVQTELKALVDQYPGQIKAMTLPKRSFQGRALDGVEIAADVNKSADDGRPVFLLVAMHHAREWPSVEAAMEFAWMLAKGYGNDARITNLLKTERIVVVPVINADGYVSSRKALDPVDQLYGAGFNPNLDNPTPDPSGGGHDLPTDCRLSPTLGGAACDVRLSLAEGIAPPGGLFAYRRKNCDGAVPNPSVPCELQYGVDPNRNYGQLWGGNGASADRTSQSYRGTGPWSEPETQAVHEYSQGRQITNIITLHNVAALVLRPPGLKSQGLAPDEAQLKEVGDRMGDATRYTSQYGWQLYDTSGTTEDWNYAAQAAFGYTIEIGPKDGEFHMPYETGFVKQWNGDYAGNGKGLREALLIGAEAAANPTYHSVIEGKAPAGRTLRLHKGFDTSTSAYCQEEAKIPLLNYGHPIIGLLPYCVNRQDPKQIADQLDTTMTVPKGGSFAWHVNPSTRPFVAEDHVIPGGISDTPASTEEFSNQEELRPSQVPPQDGDTRPTSADRSFTVPDATKRLRVTLEWPGPADDYDLELYRREADGSLSDVDTSGNSAGSFEEIVVEGDALKPGDYVLRVVNYLATDQEWHAKVERYEGQPDTVIPGQKESWTLTCEDGTGKVLETQQVQVDRGQKARVAMRCRGAKP